MLFNLFILVALSLFFFSTPVVALSAIFQTKGLVNIPIKAPDYLLKSSKFVKRREFRFIWPNLQSSFFSVTETVCTLYKTNEIIVTHYTRNFRNTSFTYIVRFAPQLKCMSLSIQRDIGNIMLKTK